MNEVIFAEKLRGICGAFGKPYPAKHVCHSIFKRVESLPDGFMDFAAERLENQPDLPKNLGYFLRHVLWPEYLDKNPGLRAPDAQHGCRQCSPDTPGFFWAYDGDGRRYSLKCSCNGSKAFEHVQAWTHAMVLDSGKYLTDPTAPEAPEYLPPAARAAIGHSEKPRPSHAREREYAESGNW